MSHKLVVSIALALSAGSVFADVPMVATLSARTLPQKQVLSSVIWRCAETTCTSVSALTLGATAACHSIAKHFGPVVAFTSEKGNLDEQQLAKCNEGAAQAK